MTSPTLLRLAIPARPHRHMTFKTLAMCMYMHVMAT
jgi:hypothetical protein